MFLEDFECQYCDFYQKEIVCKGNCNTCKLQQIVNMIYDDDFFNVEEDEEETEDYLMT